MAGEQIDLDLLRSRITRSGGQRGRGGGRARGLGAFNQFTTLLGSIQSDQTISDLTKGELTSSLNTLATANAADDRAFQSNILGNLGGINKRLQQAREGGGIFGGRQEQKQRRSALADRPGRAQTILTR